MADRRGLLIILSSPSGAGKSTLARRLRDWDPSIAFSVSATTRAPRPGEVDGKDYHFVSEAEFGNDNRLVRVPLTDVDLGMSEALVTLTSRSDKGGKVVCSGRYRRIAGYSPETLRERSQFPLTVTYEPAGELMRATRVQAETIYGKAKLQRR